jgi:hypothetical protein
VGSLLTYDKNDAAMKTCKGNLPSVTKAFNSYSLNKQQDKTSGSLDFNNAKLQKAHQKDAVRI